MKQDIYKVLSKRLREHREKLGLTQERLAEISDLHPSFIGQIERNVKKISLATLQKLAAALKVAISDLLDEKPVVYKPSGWAGKIGGMLRERPEREQKTAYRVVKETLSLTTRKRP